MKEEDELLRKCGTKNPFTVPEGYFENFSKELMEKLPEKEISLSEPVITTWQRVKPWIYMTAMFCGLMLSVRVLSDDLNKIHLYLQQRKRPSFLTNI